MPNQTFFNIPAQKRESIIETALLEFALNDYRAASVTNVVRELGIAKGSIYQYFENKKDLYFYLLDLAEKKRQDAMSAGNSKPGNDFYKWFRKVYFQALKFDLENLQYSNLLHNAAMERTASEVGDVACRTLEAEIAFFRKILKKTRKKSPSKSNADIDMQAYLLAQAVSNIPELLKLRYNLDMLEALRSGKKQLKFSKKELKELLKELSALTQFGLEGN